MSKIFFGFPENSLISAEVVKGTTVLLCVGVVKSLDDYVPKHPMHVHQSSAGRRHSSSKLKGRAPGMPI